MRRTVFRTAISLALALCLLLTVGAVAVLAEEDAGAFDYEGILGDKEGYEYDRFDRTWSYTSVYQQETSDGFFLLGLVSVSTEGGKKINFTNLDARICDINSNDLASISAIDLLIDDEVFSYKKLFQQTGSFVALGENGNLLIEALGFCDPSGVAVRLTTDKGKYTFDLAPEQLTDTLKDFCRTYLTAHMWDYYADYDILAVIEELYPLTVNGEPADYATMHKDRDLSRIDETFTAPAATPEARAARTPAPTATPKPASATMGEQNALKQAKNYLSFMAFSRSGLIKQLQYEGFTREESEYAADHCGADWYEQAVKKAESYLDFMGFSRSGLIDQLVFEGFTREQAEYAANRVGL